MYTINTQLAYFKYNLDPKNLIVNIKWFRLDKGDGFYFGCKAFSKIEIGQFKGFIDQNEANFPGSYFIEETQRQDFGRLKSNELSKTALPLYLILSQKADLHSSHRIYETMMLRLTDANSEFTIDYTLNFGVIGKIEIYKEFNPKYAMHRHYSKSIV